MPRRAAQTARLVHRPSHRKTAVPARQKDRRLPSPRTGALPSNCSTHGMVKHLLVAATGDGRGSKPGLLGGTAVGDVLVNERLSLGDVARSHSSDGVGHVRDVGTGERNVLDEHARDPSCADDSGDARQGGDDMGIVAHWGETYPHFAMYGVAMMCVMCYGEERVCVPVAELLLCQAQRRHGHLAD